MNKLILITSIVIIWMLFVASCKKESKTIDDSDPQIIEGEWKLISDFSQPSIFIKHIDGSSYFFMYEASKVYDTIEIYNINKFNGSDLACSHIDGYFYDDSTKMFIEYDQSNATYEKMSEQVDEISDYTFCHKYFPPEEIEFIIQVDSVLHVDTIQLGEIFEIKFYALIGPNECFEFLRFTPEFESNNMYFTLYGKEILADSCSGDPVYLDGSGVGITDMTVGNWNINIIQPDSTYLTSYVYVKQ